MLDVNKAFTRDDAKRKKCGWSASAFIAPELPKPKDRCERAVRDLLKQDHKNAYMLHIYSVVELMEMAYMKGQTMRSRSAN